MRRDYKSVEEEFMSYGEGSYKTERAQAKSNPLSKVIQILIALVLVAVLIILGIIGYMFTKKAVLTENISQQEQRPFKQQQPMQQSVAAAVKAQQGGVGVQSSAMVVQSQKQSLPPQQSSQLKQEMVSSTQVATQATSSLHTATQLQSTNQNQPISQQGALTSQALSQALEKKIVAQKMKIQSEQQTLPQSVAATNVQTSSQQSVSSQEQLASMSDEELVRYLQNLPPDQLKNLDLEKIILGRKKSEISSTPQKVAKTAYINNQLVLAQQSSSLKTKSTTAVISQELSQILGTKTKELPKNQYVSKLSQEVTTRKKTMRYYIVQPGDYLSKIAKKVYGKSSAYIKIYEANQDILKDPALIFPGQKLRIPAE